MKLGLFMNTQWRQGADLGPELLNLIEQVRVARASGLASVMVGQHFLSSPLQMFQATPLLKLRADQVNDRKLVAFKLGISAQIVLHARAVA